MKLHALAVTLLSTLALAACEQKPAPAPETKAEAAKPADETKPAGDAVAAAKTAEEGEEGCVYGEHHKEAAEKAGEAGCGHGEHDGHGPAGDASPGHFGAAFALGESKPLAEVLASAPSGAIQVRGEIDSVCQKAGCWMVLKDGEMKARILMKDHGFTVPMDAKGKPAVVEGTLETRTFNEKEVKHLEKDAGGDPSAVAGERKEYVLTASGIQIPNS